MTTLYKLSIHSQSLEMRGIFLVSRYVGTINQLSVRQKFFCWFSLVFQKESAIQLSKPILQHLQGGPLFMNHPVELIDLFDLNIICNFVCICNKYSNIDFSFYGPL